MIIIFYNRSMTNNSSTKLGALSQSNIQGTPPLTHHYLRKRSVGYLVARKQRKTSSSLELAVLSRRNLVNYMGSIIPQLVTVEVRVVIAAASHRNKYYPQLSLASIIMVTNISRLIRYSRKLYQKLLWPAKSNSSRLYSRSTISLANLAKISKLLGAPR